MEGFRSADVAVVDTAAIGFVMTGATAAGFLLADVCVAEVDVTGGSTAGAIAEGTLPCGTATVAGISGTVVCTIVCTVVVTFVVADGTVVEVGAVITVSDWAESTFWNRALPKKRVAETPNMTAKRITVVRMSEGFDFFLFREDLRGDVVFRSICKQNKEREPSCQSRKTGILSIHNFPEFG